MTVLTFDKLAYIDRLKAAGISERDARAHADSLDVALREQVATKADLQESRVAMKADLADMKSDILKWMVGTMFVQTGLIMAVVKFLPH
jgi:hypothetical protein